MFQLGTVHALSTIGVAVNNFAALVRALGRAETTQTSGERASAPRWFWGALLLVAALGIVQASLRLGNSLNVDEPFTANLIRLPLPEMFAAFRQDNASPPYYLLLKLWAAIFGELEVALRSLSVLLFGATIVTVGAVARRAAGPLAGVVAATLLATSSNLGLVHAGTARQYALLCLEAALAVALCFALLRATPGPSNCRLWLLLLLLDVVGSLTHATFVFVMGASVVAALLVSRRLFLAMLGVSTVAGLIYLALWGPTLLATLPLPITSWMRPPQPIDLYYGIRTLWGWKRGLLLAAYLALLLALRFRQLPGLLKSPPYLFGLIFMATALLAPYIVSQIKPVYNPDRTPVLALPIVCALSGMLIGRLGVRALTLGFIAVIVVASLQFEVKAALQPDPIPARQSMAYLTSMLRCGDTLVLGGLTVSEVEYYLRRFGAPECIARVTFPADTARHPGWIDVTGLDARRAELAREAEATVAQISRRPGARVWLFTGTDYGQEPTPIIQQELDRKLTYQTTFDLIGSFFKWIRVYSA